MKKSNKILFILVFLVAFALAFTIIFVNTRNTDKTQQNNVALDKSQWKLHSYPKFGFAFLYPDSAVVRETNVFDSPVQGIIITGTSFSLPPEYYAGTNLSADSFVSFGVIEGKCETKKYSIYNKLNLMESFVIINSKSYEKVVGEYSSKNDYIKDSVYSTYQPEQNRCYVIRFDLHSSNLDVNRGQKQFDEELLNKMFLEVFSTFKLIPIQGTIPKI